jgi:hypothetical protein
MTYTDLYLATNPVAYWEANDPPGATTLADSSGNGHTATLLGTVTLGKPGLIPGETDTAILLNASGAISCPALNLAPPFSLVGIFQPAGDGGTSTGYGALFGYSSTRRLLWGDPANTPTVNCLLAQMGGSSLFTPVNSVPAGQTAHVAYTNDGHTTETVYVNGASAASGANAAGSWLSAFYIGAYGPLPGSYQLAGTLEKVGVNATCLSAVTVAALAQAALNPPPPPSGVTPMVWNGTAWVSTSLKMFVGSQAPAGQNPNDVWIKVT